MRRLEVVAAEIVRDLDIYEAGGGRDPVRDVLDQRPYGSLVDRDASKLLYRRPAGSMSVVLRSGTEVAIVAADPGGGSWRLGGTDDLDPAAKARLTVPLQGNALYVSSHLTFEAPDIVDDDVVVGKFQRSSVSRGGTRWDFKDSNGREVLCVTSTRRYRPGWFWATIASATLVHPAAQQFTIERVDGSECGTIRDARFRWKNVALEAPRGVVAGTLQRNRNGYQITCETGVAADISQTLRRRVWFHGPAMSWPLRALVIGSVVALDAVLSVP